MTKKKSIVPHRTSRAKKKPEQKNVWQLKFSRIVVHFVIHANSNESFVVVAFSFASNRCIRNALCMRVCCSERTNEREKKRSHLYMRNYVMSNATVAKIIRLNFNSPVAVEFAMKLQALKEWEKSAARTRTLCTLQHTHRIYLWQTIGHLCKC